MFPNNVRILIVDDMMTMRKLIATTCRNLGYMDIIEAPDGMAAWKRINLSEIEEKIDLIISDWNMPNFSGLDLLRKVRGDTRFARTPFLMITAESDSAQVVEAISAGVDQYVVKPFSLNVFKEKMQETYLKTVGKG